MLKQKRGFLYILPGLLGLGIFFIVPFVASFRYIFYTGIATPEFAGLGNFIELTTNEAYRLALRNTGIFIVIGVPLLTVSALLVALFFRKSSLVRQTMLLPMIMPVASALLGWSAIFGPGGAVGWLVSALGGTAHDYFQEPFARWVMIFIFVVKNLGYMAVILAGAIESIPKELEEAFALDCSSTVRYAFRIVVPLTAPVLFFVVILSTVNCFQIFREVYGLYGSMPPESLYMLQTFMSNNFARLNYNRLCTASFIVSLFIALIVSVYLYVQRRTEKGRTGV